MVIQKAGWRWMGLCALLLAAGGRAGAQGPPAASGSYVIRSQDVLEITVWNQAGLRTQYTVDPEGTVTFAFVGRVPAAGSTPYQLEEELKKRLRNGYFSNPQVTVSVQHFRAGKVFIFGGVGAPGSIELTPNLTLIEALARAGYGAASEAIIVRTPGATGPVELGQNSASQTIRVNLREFEKNVEHGVLALNVPLQDGDTIYVPRTDKNRIFVTGEVRNPAAYSVPEGTTVLQAITLAGGLTEHASTGRIAIIRIVDGKRKTIKAKLDSLVEVGDTILVRESFF